MNVVMWMGNNDSVEGRYTVKSGRLLVGPMRHTVINPQQESVVLVTSWDSRPQRTGAPAAFPNERQITPVGWSTSAWRGGRMHPAGWRVAWPSRVDIMRILWAYPQARWVLKIARALLHISWTERQPRGSSWFGIPRQSRRLCRFRN